MSKLGERTLFRLLLDKEQVEILAMEGLDSKFLPTADLRPIYEWAMDYYHLGSRKFPLTTEILKAQEYPDNRGKNMYDVLVENGVVVDEILEEEDPHMSFALEDLKASFVTKELHSWVRDALPEVSGAIGKDKQTMLAAEATKLIGISLDLESRQTRIDLRESGVEMMEDYEVRSLNNKTHEGMHFGLPEIDAHTYGIHPGELAVLAAGPKVGKSYWLDRVALKEWEQGRVVSLFTLENSIQMTRDRIACLATHVDPERWGHGECSTQEIQDVFRWIEGFEKSSNPLHIIAPEEAHRSAEEIVLKARLLGTESLIIDQLTFMTSSNSKSDRWVQIRDIMHQIKTMISTGKDKMPCLIAHQINRKGIELARKNGYHLMEDMAEGSEVERTADWVFSMFQSEEYRQVNRVLLQILATRRAPVKNWELNWDPRTGSMRVLNEFDLPT